MNNDQVSDGEFENVYHDCETVEKLFEQIPIETIIKLYDTFRYITSLSTEDENENTTIIKIKITKKPDIDDRNFTAFEYDSLTGQQFDYMVDDNHNYDHVNAATGEIVPFPRIKHPFVPDSSDEDNELSENELKSEEKRFALSRVPKRRKLFAKYSKDSKPRQTERAKEIRKQLNLTKFVKEHRSFTEKDIPTDLMEQHDMPQEEFDDLVKTLYLDKSNYPLTGIKWRTKTDKRRTGNHPDDPTLHSYIMYKCPYSFCRFSNGSWAYTIAHLEEYHRIDQDRDKLSPFEYAMKLLYKNNTGGSQFVSEWQNSKGQWKCPYPNCNYQGTKIKTRRHVESFHQNIRYKCEFVGCDREFTSKSKMTAHIKTVHRDIRTYKCEYCEKSFKTTDARKAHTMIHTGERPFRCSKCGKGFIQATPWKTHLRNVCKIPVPPKTKMKDGTWMYERNNNNINVTNGVNI